MSRPKIGEFEVVKLNKKNIKYISRRSGVTMDDLEYLRIMRKDRGLDSEVRYKVVAE